MKRSIICGALLMLAGISAFSSGITAADSAATQAVVDARKASFKKMGAAMKTIVDQLKTDAPDKARMLAASQVIGSYSGDVSSWFPAGSGPGAGVDTDALPYIWEARAKFDAIAEQLAPETKNLSAALAGDDMAAIRIQAKKLSSVCSDCHHSFRGD